MKIWEGIILGLVQGLTEFLPVSSSGHLFLLEKLGVGNESLFFNVCMHLGTLLSVLIVMRKKWLPLVRKPFQKTNLFILLSCLPTVGFALLTKALAPALLALGFMITAVFLFCAEKLHFDRKRTLSVKTSILSGVFQGIAVLPGVSRSGATITALTLVGVDKTESADFSFLMSIPVILGSAILEILPLISGDFTLATGDILPLILGTVTAFLSGCFAIKFFLKIVSTKSLLPFSIYTFLMSIVSMCAL